MTNELTVRVQNPVIPAMSWNKDEVQQNLDEMLAAYTGRVYTPESIKGAKDDRAKINNWDKQLGAAVTAAKKIYLKPLEDFQADIKTMREQCKKVSGAIDEQVKAVEQAEKDEKASTLKLVYRDCIGELEPLISFERLLDTHWLNKTFDQLRTLPDHLKDKLEFLCNECCWPGCKGRRACYEAVSRKNLGEDGPEHRCTAPDAQGGYRFSKAMENPAFIGINDIQKTYLPIGFSNFKIEGRGLGSALILEFLLYYMTKPEHQLRVREAIYLDNMLDLF